MCPKIPIRPLLPLRPTRFGTLGILSPEKAALHGMVCADGYFVCGLRTPSDTGERYYITLAEPDPSIRRLFASYMFRQYGVRARDNAALQTTRIYGKKVVLDMATLGPFGNSHWRVPVKRLDCASARAWLRSYFDGDGDVRVSWTLSKCKVRAKSVNLRGLRGVRQVLLSFFNVTSKIYRHGKPKRPNWSQSYDLEIIGSRNLLAFAGRIGFNHPAKQRKLNRIVALIRTKGLG